MNERLLGNLTFKVADSRERASALALRERIYTAELGDPGLDPFDHVATHLVATTSDGQVVAALRLALPEARPFDLERYFDLSRLLDPIRRPSEVSRFCVDTGFRQIHRTQMAHLGMLKLLVAYAQKQQVSDILTLCFPDLRKLYRVALFREFGAACQHSKWGVAHLMRLDLINLLEDDSLSRHPIGRLLRATDLPNIIV